AAPLDGDRLVDKLLEAQDLLLPLFGVVAQDLLQPLTQFAIRGWVLVEEDVDVVADGMFHRGRLCLHARQRSDLRSEVLRADPARRDYLLNTERADVPVDQLADLLAVQRGVEVHGILVTRARP